jgi:hypothetical protein
MCTVLRRRLGDWELFDYNNFLLLYISAAAAIFYLSKLYAERTLSF